jgi:glycosyltransferase involved in cell wall biosynthesis
MKQVDLSHESRLGETSTDRPTVSVGLPVYNGETYLRLLLDSVLAQTVGEFELIISDNASTDSTEAICREYAAADARIRYHRQPRNRGVTWNFRQVALLASGKYFLWTSHDDILAPNYVERCVEVLDRDPSVVLCYSNSIHLDEAGNQFEPTQRLEFDQPSPHQRFRRLIGLSHNCTPLYGLIRLDVLKKTSIQDDFADGDRCMLVELGLYGTYHRIQEPLFYHREHAGRFTHQHPSRQERTRLANPDRTLRFIFPFFRVLKEYALAVYRAPLSWVERFRCYLYLLNWVCRHVPLLCGDLKSAFLELTKPRSRTGLAKTLGPNAAGSDSVSR